MSTYSPGTVAVATVRGVPGKRVIRCMEHGHRSWFVPGYMPSESGNGWWPDDDEVTDVRPLVVLDLPDHCIKQVLGDIRWAHSKTHNARLADIANQIEAQNRPPKPEEPTGLGAVVEDAHGCKWVRLGGADLSRPWGPDGDIGGGMDSWRTYADIDAVRILSAGVSQ